MTKRDAYQLGIESGYESGLYGDFTQAEFSNEEAFLAACFEMCENKRQYADSPTYDMTGHKNTEGLFDAFEEGESIGAQKAWREHKNKLLA